MGQPNSPEDGAKFAKPAPLVGLDLYNRGAPLWTRAFLKDVQAQINEDVPEFVIHYIDTTIGLKQNEAHKKPERWHTKVMFFGYRHTVGFRHATSTGLQGSAFNPQCASYWISQTCLDDPANKKLLVSRYSVNRLDSLFKTAIHGWLSHEARRKVVIPLFGTEISPTINKVICFGLGNNLSVAFPYWTQHPAAISIRSAVRQKLGHKVRLLTHYPNYTPDTKAVLERHKFEVMGKNGVDGFVEVDENSIVFVTSSDVPVTQILAELARPAIIITRSFKEVDLDWKCPVNTKKFYYRTLGSADALDPDTPRTKAMFADYNAIPLWEGSGEEPRPWAPWLTTAMQVYIRKKDYKPKEVTRDDFESWFEPYD
ncbi:hypothetical protein F4801DRAFT_583086 [Xylaria longipes]|nr:hypothetical protein F4801DRAFT_583086 [Xylaria longipes]